LRYSFNPQLHRLSTFTGHVDSSKSIFEMRTIVNYRHRLSKNARKATVLCCGGLVFWAMMMYSGTNAKETPNNIAPGRWWDTISSKKLCEYRTVRQPFSRSDCKKLSRTTMSIGTGPPPILGSHPNGIDITDPSMRLTRKTGLKHRGNSPKRSSMALQWLLDRKMTQRTRRLATLRHGNGISL
jgi:hypothetical protein